MPTTGRKVLKIQTWRLNYTLVNNQKIMEEIKKKIQILIETNENKTQQP